MQRHLSNLNIELNVRLSAVEALVNHISTACPSGRQSFVCKVQWSKLVFRIIKLGVGISLARQIVQGWDTLLRSIGEESFEGYRHALAWWRSF